jgi:hypothetical protein
LSEHNQNISEDFPDWIELEKYMINDFRPKVVGHRLYKIAKIWRQTHELPKELIGHHWTWCVVIAQEKIWNFKEFKEGRKFGHNPKEPYRDANPYTERARNRSWDCGYLWGCAERYKREKKREGGNN